MRPSSSETGSYLLDRASYRFTGAAAAFINLALQNPMVESLWWPGLGVAAILGWFLAKKMIKGFRHEYRYEEDDNTTDQS